MLTLSQTGKLDRPILILLYGSSYWKEIINFKALLENGMISEDDLGLFHFVDDPLEALSVLQRAMVPGAEAAAPPAFAKSVTPRTADSRPSPRKN